MLVRWTLTIALVIAAALLVNTATAHDKDCAVDPQQVRLTASELGESAPAPPSIQQRYGYSPVQLRRITSHAFARGWIYDVDSFRIVLANLAVRQQELDQVAVEQEQECLDEHAELHARPRVELLSTTIRDCGFNDCMVFRLRNNWHLRVTDVQIRVYPRDRWGSAFTRCGYYGGTWTWWRVNGQPDGATFTLQNDESCFRGLGPESSGVVSRVQFSDGTTWRP